jgi:hypothetical protein
MIYIQSFINVGHGIQKFMEGIHRHHGGRISLLLFFQNDGSKLKIRCSGLSQNSLGTIEKNHEPRFSRYVALKLKFESGKRKVCSEINNDS